MSLSPYFIQHYSSLYSSSFNFFSLCEINSLIDIVTEIDWFYFWLFKSSLSLSVSLKLLSSRFLTYIRTIICNLEILNEYRSARTWFLSRIICIGVTTQPESWRTRKVAPLPLYFLIYPRNFSLLFSWYPLQPHYILLLVFLICLCLLVLHLIFVCRCNGDENIDYFIERKLYFLTIMSITNYTVY